MIKPKNFNSIEKERNFQKKFLHETKLFFNPNHFPVIVKGERLHEK